MAAYEGSEWIQTRSKSVRNNLQRDVALIHRVDSGVSEVAELGCEAGHALQGPLEGFANGVEDGV